VILSFKLGRGNDRFLISPQRLKISGKNAFTTQPQTMKLLSLVFENSQLQGGW